MCAVSRHRLSPPSGSCTTLLHAVSTALGLRRYVVYRSQVLYVAKVYGAPACSRGFPRPGWAAGNVSPLAVLPQVWSYWRLKSFFIGHFACFQLLGCYKWCCKGHPCSFCLSLKWPQREPDKDRRDAQNPIGFKYIQEAWPCQIGREQKEFRTALSSQQTSSNGVWKEWGKCGGWVRFANSNHTW